MSSNPTIISSTSPLKRIMHAVRMIEKGEYDSLILRDLMAESGELGQLARKLDEMALIVLHRDNHLRMLNKVIPVGVSLSAERDFNRLLETVVAEAQAFTNADAGTMYLLEGRELRFVILRNTSLDLKMGGTSGEPIRFKPIQLYGEDGSENLSNVASYAALKKQRVKVADAYTAEGFDFSGTRAFDSQTGYRSKSFLTTPLENKEGQVIGILQLINARNEATGEITEFKDDEVLEALVMLATAALDGYIREAALRQEIAKLRIEIDQPRRTRQVEEITDTEFFRSLQAKAQVIREKNRK